MQAISNEDRLSRTACHLGKCSHTEVVCEMHLNFPVLLNPWMLESKMNDEKLPRISTDGEHARTSVGFDLKR